MATGAPEKQWDAFTPTSAYADVHREKGCTLISPTNDVKLVAAGLVATKETFSSLW